MLAAGPVGQRCLFCSGDAHEPDHAARCDGRQGHVEATMPPPLRFDGDDYVPPRDDPRLTGQYYRIFALMRDQAWRSLPEIERRTGAPPASISAQLRHMRKPRFGGHTVNRRYLGDGLYEYQLVVRVGARVQTVSTAPKHDQDEEAVVVGSHRQ
jgi:hypothetical protein